MRLDYSFAHPSVNLVNRQPLHPLNFHITEHFECVSRTLVNRTSAIVSSYLPASRAIEQSDVRLIVSELRFNLVLRLVLTGFRGVFRVFKKFSSFFFRVLFSLWLPPRYDCCRVKMKRTRMVFFMQNNLSELWIDIKKKVMIKMEIRTM